MKTINEPIELPSVGFFKRVNHAVHTVVANTDPINNSSISSRTLRLLHHPLATKEGMGPVTVLAPGVVTATATPNLQDINPRGNTSGGVSFIYADTAMAVAAQSLDLESGKTAVTTKANLMFADAIKPGEKLTVTATALTPITDSRVTVGSVVRNAQGKTVFSAAADFYYKSPENSSSTLNGEHQNWTATASGNEALSLKNKDLKRILTERLQGNIITITYNDDGDLTDGIEITIDDYSENPPASIFIELNSTNDEDLQEELDSLLKMIQLAEPASVQINPLNESTERAHFIFEKMQEFFGTVA